MSKPERHRPQGGAPLRSADDVPASGSAGIYRTAVDLARQLTHSRTGIELETVAGRAARTLEQISRLHGMSMALAAVDSSGDGIGVALDQALTVMDAVVAHVALAGESDGSVQVSMLSRSLSAQASANSHPADADSLLSTVIRSTDHVWILPTDDALVANDRRLVADLRAARANLVAIVPLQVGERRLGALSLGWRDARELQPEEQDLLRACALQVGLALELLRLIEAERSARATAVAEAQKNADLLNSISDGFVAFDRNLRFLYVNRAAVELAGRPATEVLGRRFEDILPEGATSPFPAAAHQAMETGEPFTLEVESVLLNRWIEARGYPSSDGISVLFRDATYRKLSERRQTVLAEMSRVFDSGLNRNLMMQRIAELVVPAIADACTIELQENGRVEQVAFARAQPATPLKSMREVPLRSRGTRIGTIRTGFAPDRPRIKGLGFLTDVAQRVATAVELSRLYEAEQRARREAEAANRAKAEFLAVMSHELRTPLNAIGGYAELMELGVHGPLPPAYHDFVARIRSSEEHLLNLINTVLSFAKLEAGSVEYRMEDVPVAETLQQLEPVIGRQVEEKRLTYHVQVEPGLTVRADPERLRQILLNLLSNAIKFTPNEGSISIAASATNECGRIDVRDTGAGIPSDKIDIIFDPFVQAESGLTRNTPGVGLGLAISRDLARGMGGDLTVQSKPGSGSIFTLELPLAAA